LERSVEGIGAKITPRHVDAERYKRIRTLYARACDLAEQERDAFVAEPDLALRSPDRSSGLPVATATTEGRPPRKRVQSEWEISHNPTGEKMARKTRYTTEQIALALQQHQAGIPTHEIIRKYGISQQTFYRWRSRYGGLGRSEVRRLKQLEDENRRLKQLVADLTLDKRILQDVLAKKE